MNVVVLLEQRFSRTPDGHVWTDAQAPYQFWQRYLAMFDHVRVAARVRDVDSPPPQHMRADGPGVAFACVPYYLGPWQYLRRAAKVRQAVRQAVGPEDAVIMRVGSQLGNCLFPRLKRERHPYGLEVVGDPWDVFAPGTIRHPLRPLLRRYFRHQLRQQCSHACAAAYVTERTLQARYPVGTSHPNSLDSSVGRPDDAIRQLAVGVSDVELPGAGFADAPRGILAEGPFRLVFVGSLAQLYKAPDLLLAAVSMCLRSGLKLRLSMIGGGRFQPQLERQATQLGIEDAVDFRGQLATSQAVRTELDRADLFVLPSRTEGLPRALIEAMARGLPCIASDVGGIPELLPSEDVFPAGDSQALAQKIREVLSDSLRRRRMSERNLSRARDFHEDVLHARRLQFYGFVRTRTEDWLRRKAAA